MADTAEGSIEALDEAVRAFARGPLDRKGVVTGWVLMVATSRFGDDGQPLHAYNYSVGPDCDLIRAVGLVELGRDRMRYDIDGGN